MTDRVNTYENYLMAWSGIPNEERLPLLRRCVSADVEFLNRSRPRRGIADVADHLENFQRLMPGASFRLNNMIGWGDRALAEWQLVDASGKAGFSGYDCLTFDADALITGIVLFSNVEEQKIVWRMRDMPLLEPAG